jgi:hypothetical protein
MNTISLIKLYPYEKLNVHIKFHSYTIKFKCIENSIQNIFSPNVLKFHLSVDHYIFT